MSLPDYQAFMLPTLRTAAEVDATMRDGLVARVCDALHLDGAARTEVLPFNGQPVVEARVQHAAKDLVVAGLLREEGGAFAVTPRGRDVLSDGPASIDRAYLERFDEYAAHRAAVLRRRGA